MSKLILKRNSKGEGTKKSKECQRVVGSGGEWWGIVETGEECLRVVGNGGERWRVGSKLIRKRN